MKDVFFRNLNQNIFSYKKAYVFAVIFVKIIVWFCKLKKFNLWNLKDGFWKCIVLNYLSRQCSSVSMKHESECIDNHFKLNISSSRYNFLSKITRTDEILSFKLMINKI